MSQETLQLIRARTSVNHFDPAGKLSDEEISELISYAVEAPSSFNQQNWRFIAVREQAAKEKLKAVAFGQQKIADGRCDLHHHRPSAWLYATRQGIQAAS